MIGLPKARLLITAVRRGAGRRRSTSYGGGRPAAAEVDQSPEVDQLRRAPRLELQAGCACEARAGPWSNLLPPTTVVPQADPSRPWAGSCSCGAPGRSACRSWATTSRSGKAVCSSNAIESRNARGRCPSAAAATFRPSKRPHVPYLATPVPDEAPAGALDGSVEGPHNETAPLLRERPARFVTRL
jgi:hypothetical protein